MNIFQHTQQEMMRSLRHKRIAVAQGRSFDTGTGVCHGGCSAGCCLHHRALQFRFLLLRRCVLPRIVELLLDRLNLVRSPGQPGCLLENPHRVVSLGHLQQNVGHVKDGSGAEGDILGARACQAAELARFVGPYRAHTENAADFISVGCLEAHGDFLFLSNQLRGDCVVGINKIGVLLWAAWQC